MNTHRFPPHGRVCLSNLSRLFALTLIICLILTGMIGVTGSSAQASCVISASRDVNKRAGAGTGFDTIGQLAAGVTVEGIAQQMGADGYIWWQLDDGSFVRSDVVTASAECSALPAPAASDPSSSVIASDSGIFSLRLPADYASAPYTEEIFGDGLVFGSSEANLQMIAGTFEGGGGLNASVGVAGLIAAVDPAELAGLPMADVADMLMPVLLGVVLESSLTITNLPEDHVFGGLYQGQLAEFNLGMAAVLYTDDQLLIAFIFTDDFAGYRREILNILDSIRIPAEVQAPPEIAFAPTNTPQPRAIPSGDAPLLTMGVPVAGEKWEIMVNSVSHSNRVDVMMGYSAMPQSGYTFLLVSITIHNQLTGVTLPSGSIVWNGVPFYERNQVPNTESPLVHLTIIDASGNRMSPFSLAPANADSGRYQVQESAFALSSLALLDVNGNRIPLNGIGAGENGQEFVIVSNLLDLNPALRNEETEFTLLFTVPTASSDDAFQFQFEDFPLITLIEPPLIVEPTPTARPTIEPTPTVQAEVTEVAEAHVTTISGLVTFADEPLAGADVLVVPYERRTLSSSQRDIVSLAVDTGFTRQSAENGVATMAMLLGDSAFADMTVYSTVSDENGQFELTLPAGSYSMAAVASFGRLGTCATIDAPLLEVTDENKQMWEIVFPSYDEFAAAGAGWRGDSDRFYLCL